MSQLLEPTTLTKPGFRLQRLEVYNWGTFDSIGDGNRGEVYCIEPNGDTTLLIGRNGSGKSTLVDAVLTLLVRPAVRNYNVAAGAKKRERDERTYIRGAYDRRSGDQDSGAQVQYLRPGNANYSVLLACFHNAMSGQTFTIAQVLYITADGKADRVKQFVDGPGSGTRWIEVGRFKLQGDRDFVARRMRSASKQKSGARHQQPIAKM